MSKPIPDAVPRLRQRQLADGSWRIWWEPERAVRRLGFETVQLDPGKLTWSRREAEKMNRLVERTRAEGGRMVTPVGGRTIATLIDMYRRNEMFLKLAPKTRKDYNTRLNTIETKWGGQLVVSFSKPVMREWYETLKRNNGSWQAVAQLRIMSLLFSFAELKGWRAEGSNPCAKLKMTIPAPRSRASAWAEFDALIKAADDLGWPSISGAIALSALHGQRQTDVRQAGIAFFKDMDWNGEQVFVWFFTRSKRDNQGVVPVHPIAAPRIRALIAAARPGQTVLLVDEASGQPYSEGLFQDRWAAVRARAAKTHPSVASLQFRDLRRSFGVWARAGGAGRDDVGNVLGNSASVDPRLNETYMPPSFDTASRAVAAVRRPDDKERKAG